MRLWRGGVELDVGPRQQAYLLALLLAREGRPVSTTELIDLMWDDDVPASALNVIHKYVGALRRLLEPGLPARGTGSYLHRRGNGYLFTAGPGTLDLVAFRERVATAQAASAQQRHEAALDNYVEALGLWHGPAGDGLTHGPTVVPIFAALDAELYDACAAAAELAVSLARAEQVLPALHLAASMAPLHEPVQAGLVCALAAAGRQAEALSVFSAVRARLAEDLGIDPGPVLQDAHRRVLMQQTPPSATATGTDANVGGAQVSTSGSLVGRAEELAVLRRTMEPAFAGGTAIGVVEGEPGVGKTRLLEEAVAEAAGRGALVVWGRCLDGDGTPSMWPWVQAIGTFVDGLSSAAREEWLAGDLGRLVEPRGDVLAAPLLPDSGFRFRLFERVVAVMGQASAQRPVVLVIDDLQWADGTSLQLFEHVAARLPAGTVILGALRDRAPAPGPELSRMLAAVSRAPGHRRFRLGPLNRDDVAELVRRETGRTTGPDTARSTYARTAGNPFFVLELTRLLADGGELTDAAGAGVPTTVRDVVLDRMAGLDGDARDLLRIAALIGRDVELGLLARVAGLDVASCLERLEPVTALGMLESGPDNPFSFRFAHDLVREAVSATTPPSRASRLHLRVSDALDDTDPDGESVAERLAHHLWAAGPLAEPARTAAALVRAGGRAAGKSALEAAERQLRSAARVARTAGLAELELTALSQLTAVVGMRSMYGFSSLELLERAEHLARSLGRESEAAGFLYSRWAAHAQAVDLDRSGPLARRLLDQGEASSDPFVLACGLHAWGIHQWHVGRVGEAFRYLGKSRPMVLDLARREEDPVRHDLQLLMTGLLAEITAMHGDVEAARDLLEVLEDAAGDDPYMITVWATMAVRTASVVGDPVQALHGAERGIAVDPGFSFVFLGTYQRLARCWALAMTGNDPAGAAAEAQRIITANLLDPPRSCVATWYGLLGEMWLAGGALNEAAAALDQADLFLNSCGQRYMEGLLLLLRARLLQAFGEPVAVVRAAAEKARELSTEREAHLFAHRAERFLEELEEPAGG
ncbi:AAA family ATPase [Streptomyces sp. NBC_01478]|uniref:BTAD domain-containing putative transcriptional regulator n=1 Tax=Streptomyces sp. NBC_01478 TaxID=2903882 RepID=UPI002E3539A0|nr:BTAD domain-containing putative transcriptional regulator [Streptomyces sp. NBC_01478]